MKDAAVVAVAGHDTASAAYALPLERGEAFMIAGSWNVVGFEAAAVPEGMVREGFGIEGGAEGRALVTKSLAGLRLVRRLRDDLGGAGVGFSEISQMARAALLRGGVLPALDTSDEALDAAFIPAARRQLGDTIRDEDLPLALYLGLARKVAAAVEQIARLRGGPATALRLGGGGAQDAFLCELLAASLGIPIIAGPVEASATGNALFQLIGMGRICDLSAARALVASSGLTREYRPSAELARRLEGEAC